MADVYNANVRSAVMSNIRKTNTKPELTVRKFLFSRGFRYRLYYKKLPGNPDIVFVKKRIAVFVNGCFWHAHQNCKYNKLPKSNIEYWHNKINKNVERDRNNILKLRDLGWQSVIIWECQLKQDNFNEVLENLAQRISNG